MSQAGDVLRRAAADVEVRGVLRPPKNGETCAIHAIGVIRDLDRLTDQHFNVTANALRKSAGIGQLYSISSWNDSQPSRATVAAEMRSAANLADLLYGGTA